MATPRTPLDRFSDPSIYPRLDPLIPGGAQTSQASLSWLKKGFSEAARTLQRQRGPGLRSTLMTVKPDPKGPGQESVWDYPRPPRAELTSRRLQILHRGVILADTRRGVRTLETSHPPSYYFPPEDVASGCLRQTARRSFCEWKGDAVYYDVIVEDAVLADAAWSYPKPTAPFAGLRDHVAFYAGRFDRCLVDDVLVQPQPGGFYGGWITPDVAGPFKGVPGSDHW